MPDKIIHIRSLTPGSVPTTSSLGVGEIAINVNDGKIFVRQSGSLGDTIQTAVTTNNTTTGSVRISGSVQVTGSLNAPNITGSLFGTSSWALSASIAPNYLPIAGGTISGSLIIQNNLTVLGSASIQYISESTLNIGTNLITVNTFNPGARFGGLAVIDSGSSPQVSASFLYDSVQDEFIFVHRGTSTSAITSSHFLLGPETYNNLGNENYLTANRIPKGKGNEHLNDSNISDNGSVVSVNSNTQITGSLSQGDNNITTGVFSHAEGNSNQTGITTAFATKQAITSGLVVFINGYGDISSYFTPGGYLYIYDAEFGNDIGWGAYLIDTVTGGTPTEIQLVDTGVNTTGIAYVGDITYLLNNGTFGGDRTIPGPYAHSEGIQTKAIGKNSHAEGDQSQALGQQGHAEGEKSQAIGNNSHAEGYQSQAIGDYSHAEGSNTKAIGLYSHAEGQSTQAIGNRSHAEGIDTQAIGNYSHAEGFATIALGDYQHVQGQYNITSSEQSAFIIGNGADDSNRSNLIHAAGNNVQVTGSLIVSGSSTLTNIGPAIFSGSLIVTQGISGSFSGSGANLSGIPASGIVGLNLSQIATGSVTASVSPSQFTITSGSSTELVVTGTGVTLGSLFTDVHSVTGSFNVSGSARITNGLTVTGSLTVTGGITGSLFGTSSWSNNAISSSFSSTASLAPNYVLTSTTSSMLQPYVLTASTSSMTVLSASFASTASFIPSLSNYVKILHSSGSQSSIHTGTTANTLVASYLIPANEIADNQTIEFEFKASKLNTTAGGIIYRVYINTSSSLSGATQIAQYNPASVASVQGFAFRRRFTRRSGNLLFLPATSITTGVTDYVAFAGTVQSGSVTFSSDQYIITSVELASSGQQVVIESAQITKI